MPMPVAHVASLADPSGQLRVVYRYADGTTLTVLVDPVTKEQQLESEGVAALDENDAPSPTWWAG